MSEATCQNAFSAGRTPRPNGDDQAFFRSCRNTSEAVSATVPITSQKPTPRSLPPLVLTHAMRQTAFQIDHAKALRGNRARAGRIAQEAKAATMVVLGKGC